MMDMTVLANFLLFFGLFGASFAAEVNAADEEDDADELYDRGNYARTDTGTNGNDDVTADRDNLAWFLGNGDDSLDGSSERDYADLGNGDDDAAMGAGNDIVEAGAGNDTVAGGNGDDLAFGDAGADALDGGLGNDSLAGDEGDDWLTGGGGFDVLAGGAGNDVMSGFSSLGGATASMSTPDGADQLFGGLGDDRLVLGRGDDATGGTGADRFELDVRWQDGTAGATITDYMAGEDQLIVNYLPTFDPVTSLPVVPTLTVQASADGQSSVILLNGAAIATVEGVTGLTVEDIQLQADSQTDAGFRPENFDGVLPATPGDDDLTGTAGRDYGRLGLGDDVATGAEGNDSLLGEAGDDMLSGDAGQDTLLGGDGADALNGGAGIDRLSGGLGADLVLGDDGADHLLGGAGNDTLSGFDPDGAGGTASTIDGVDTVSGGDGDDTLIVGRGDLVSGGAGSDLFELDATLNSASPIATITDYTPGVDQVELHYTPELNAQGVPIPPVVAVLMGPNNAYAVITLNSEPVAQLTGATTLTLADILLVPHA